MKSLTRKSILYFIFIFSTVSLLSCQSRRTRAVSHPFDVAWDDRDLFREGLIDSEKAVVDRMTDATVYHIEFRIPDDFSILTGHEEVRYTNQEEGALHDVYFRLFPNIAGGKSTVSAVNVDGQEVEPVYEYSDSAIRISLPTALHPGERIDIKMDFEIEIAREMAGNYGLFGYYDGVLVLDKFYPVIPVYDDEGWNVENPPPNGDLSYFDASFYLVRVTAPANLTVATSGIEVGREYEAKNQVLTFAAGPSRDFYLAAGEDYSVVSETVGETTVNSYAFSNRVEGAKLALQFARQALQSLNDRLGVYPYTEFDVVGTPMMALGIEYPGIVGISLETYDLDAEVSGSPAQIMLESVVAHEAAHQWFYNIIGNDQVDEPWLDEALTQYATGLYYLDAYGEGAERSYRESWRSRWDRVEGANIPIGLPAGDYSSKEYGAIVYGRGPLFVAALAQEMGQETFDEFLWDYIYTFKWGVATSDGFRQLAEKHCQCDLTAIFEEWVYKK